MPDLADGETAEMKGSGSKPYVLKNAGGVYSCSCPAWRNQSTPIERRTCKHLRKLRGDAAEDARLGGPCREAGARPDGAEAAAGPPLLLAESWDDAADLAGWWMSEKLDGVRAYWDGKQFLSRLGNVFHAPDWFTAGLPGRARWTASCGSAARQFQRTVGIVRRQDKPDVWKAVRFLVFDAPAAGGPVRGAGGVPAGSCWPAGPASTPPSTPTRRAGDGPPAGRAARVEALGGEGLMLRNPGSRYEAGRSTTLLKVKSSTTPRRWWSATSRARGGTKGGSGRWWCGSRTARGSASAPGSRTRSGPTRRRSARPSRSGIRSCRRPGCRGSRCYVGVRADAPAPQPLAETPPVKLKKAKKKLSRTISAGEIAIQTSSRFLQFDRVFSALTERLECSCVSPHVCYSPSRRRTRTDSRASSWGCGNPPIDSAVAGGRGGARPPAACCSRRRNTRRNCTRRWWRSSTRLRTRCGTTPRRSRRTRSRR